MPGSLTQLRAAMDNASDMMFVVDDAAEAQGGPFICYANASFARELGVDPADVIGKSPGFMFGPDSDAASVNALRSAMLTMSRARIELLTYRQNGDPLWVSWTATGWSKKSRCDAAGSPLGGTRTNNGGLRTNFWR